LVSDIGGREHPTQDDETVMNGAPGMECPVVGR